MKKIFEKVKALCLLLGLTVAFSAVASAQQTPPAGDLAQVSAAEALSRYEKALQATTEPEQKFYSTTKGAATALAAGENEKAKTYARSLLQEVEVQKDSWYFGNAIHVGNLILGLVALTEGDVTEAKRCLLEAGNLLSCARLAAKCL